MRVKEQPTTASVQAATSASEGHGLRGQHATAGCVNATAACAGPCKRRPGRVQASWGAGEAGGAARHEAGSCGRARCGRAWARQGEEKIVRGYAPKKAKGHP
jgi:hypothetical protein